MNKKTIKEYNDLLSDVYFVYGIDIAAKMHAKTSSGRVYNYM